MSRPHLLIWVSDITIPLTLEIGKPKKGRDIPAFFTAHNWTTFSRVRSYGSTAFTAVGFGSKHSTGKLTGKPLPGNGLPGDY